MLTVYLLLYAAHTVKVFQQLAGGDAAATASGVAADQGLLALPFALMCELLGNDGLRSRSEQVVYGLALQWARAQATPLPDPELAQLFGRVRYGLLPKEVAVALIDEPLLQGPLCREVLLKAFVAAAHGDKPAARFPNTVAAAKAAGFSPTRAREAGFPWSDIFPLCTPLVRLVDVYDGQDVVTVSGVLGKLYSLRTGYHGMSYRICPEGAAASQRDPIELANVRMLQWAETAPVFGGSLFVAA